jgi:hypothetical protein
VAQRVSREPRLGPVARMYYRDYLEAKETIRELRFKAECYGVLLQFCLDNLPEDARNVLGSGLFRLVVGHTRGEHPLSWWFEDRNVRVE